LSAECACERILSIDQQMAKIWIKIKWHVFIWPSLYKAHERVHISAKWSDLNITTTTTTTATTTTRTTTTTPTNTTTPYNKERGGRKKSRLAAGEKEGKVIAGVAVCAVVGAMTLLLLWVIMYTERRKHGRAERPISLSPPIFTTFTLAEIIINCNTGFGFPAVHPFTGLSVCFVGLHGLTPRAPEAGVTGPPIFSAIGHDSG